MREILFRGKDIKTKNWVCGYYFKAVEHWTNKGIHEDWIACTAIQNGGMCNVCRKFPVMKETVGQFTGLTDKNGKKIFEGDIVEATYGCELMDISEVKRNLVVSYGRFGYGSQIGFMCDFPLQGCLKVIGNIHDNPELLEGK